MPEKFDIFISHIHEESYYANKLKERIQSDFSVELKVFVSSDDKSIRAGLLMKQMVQAITGSRFFIALCSEESIVRPWIPFEIGIYYALHNNKEPRLMRYLEMSQKKMTSPYDQFAIKKINKIGLRWLYDDIAKEFNCKKIKESNINESYRLLIKAESEQLKISNNLKKVKLCNAVGGFVYRVKKGSIEILLIRTRDKQRYIIPKGKIVNNSHEDSLINELNEEAGIVNPIIIEDITPSTANYRKGNGKSQRIAIYAIKSVSDENNIPFESDRNPEWQFFDQVSELIRKGREEDNSKSLINALTSMLMKIKNKEMLS